MLVFVKLACMKTTSILVIIFVLLSSCSETNKGIDQDDSVSSNLTLSQEPSLGDDFSIRDGDSLYEKSELIHSVRIKNTSYQLYENLICIAHNTTIYPASVDSYSTKSLSLFQNGIFKKELFKKDLFIEGSDLGEVLNKVFVSTISSDEEKTLLQIDFEVSPSTPGCHTMALIQLKELDIKETRVTSIVGEFITSNGEIDGLGWSGYFAFDLPYKLTEMHDKLELDVDPLKIQHENDFYFLKIKDGIRFPPRVCELDMTIDPFGDKPLAKTTVALDPNTKITLLYMAVDTLVQTWYFKYWVKIKVADKEGWIINDVDLWKIGCQAAG